MTNNLLHELENTMSQWLDDTLAAIKTVFNGSASDATTQKAVADLNARLTSDEATEAEQTTAITALVAALAAAPAAPGTPPVA